MENFYFTVDKIKLVTYNSGNKQEWNMKQLKEKEAVLCETFHEFKKTILKFFPESDEKRIKRSWGYCINENVCVCTNQLNSSDWEYANVEYYQGKKFNILSFTDAVGNYWKPDKLCKYWQIRACNNMRLDVKERINFGDWFDKKYIANNNYFRTRQLAREAKKSIQEVLKKAKKG